MNKKTNNNKNIATLGCPALPFCEIPMKAPAVCISSFIKYKLLKIFKCLQRNTIKWSHNKNTKHYKIYKKILKRKKKIFLHNPFWDMHMPQTTSNAQDLQWSVRCDTDIKKDIFSNRTLAFSLKAWTEWGEPNRHYYLVLKSVSMALITFKHR